MQPVIMSDTVLSCYKCGHALRVLPRDRIHRSDTCAACGADLYCCVHCRYFDPSRSNECSEPQAEWVRDKEAANFCGYFEPRTSLNLTARGGRSRGADARAAFDNLFKKH